VSLPVPVLLSLPPPQAPLVMIKTLNDMIEVIFFMCRVQGNCCAMQSI